MSDSDRHADSRPTARQAATEIVRKLVSAGHIAYFAGGCVRDHLMGHEPDDYDVATSARPEQVQEVFPKARGVGESFGVMLVRVMGHTTEVATFRSEGPYSDSRRPDEVHFTDAEHDAMRRDFTINGLFEDPLEEKIIDFVGGQKDVEARIIRAIGDPHERIAEDRLRMLRAIRFAARFAFAIDSETADAVRARCDDLRGVSRERVGQEVKRMFTNVNRAVAAWELQYLGLDSAVLDEEHKTVAPTRLGRLPDQSPYPTALAAWLLDRHEAEAGDRDAIHETAKRWARSLMLSNAEQAAMRRALEIYQTLTTNWLQLGIAKQKRLATDPGFVHGLALLLTSDRPAFIDVKRRVSQLAETPSGISPDPLIDGRDLINAGHSPGPGFQNVLDAVYDAQLEGQIATKGEALELANLLARQELSG